MKLTRYIINKFKKWNVIIDSILTVPQIDELKKRGLQIEVVNYDSESFNKFKDKFLKYEKLPDKKMLEFFTTYNLLGIQRGDKLLDAAAGNSIYVKVIQDFNFITTYITDHIFKSTFFDDKRNTYIVAGDISSLSIPDESIDKISCHHAFEHFQEQKDVEFIKECWRVLAPRGCVVIAPIFMADRYVECWNIDKNTLFDSSATLIIDKSASLPGADDDGHFARIYSSDSLNERITNLATQIGFKAELFEILIGGKRVPEMKKQFGSKLNYPLRALKLVKK